MVDDRLTYKKAIKKSNAFIKSLADSGMTIGEAIKILESGKGVVITKTFNTLDYTKEYITVPSGEKRTYLDQQSLSRDMASFKREIRKAGMTPIVETLLNVIKITGVKK